MKTHKGAKKKSSSLGVVSDVINGLASTKGSYVIEIIRTKERTYKTGIKDHVAPTSHPNQDKDGFRRPKGEKKTAQR